MRYTKEEKEHILGQFHASGMTMKRACAVLPGFPHHQTLAKWLRAEERGELTAEPVRVRGRCESHEYHKRYPAETRREAVRLLESGFAPCAVAKRLGVRCASTVSYWARVHNAKKAQAGYNGAGAPKAAPAGAGRKGRPRPARRAAGEGGAPMPPREKGPGRPPEREEAFDWAKWGELPEDPAERAREAEIKLAEALAVLDVRQAPGPGSLSNPEKHRAGSRAAASCPLLGVDRVLSDFSIARSTFYEQAGRGRKDRYAALRARLRREFEAAERRAGSECLWQALRRGEGEPVKARDLAEGDLSTPVVVSEKVVRRVMAEEGLVPVQAQARGVQKYSSYEGETDERPANSPLLEDGVHHDFHSAEPGKLVVSDVTEFRLGGFKAYLSVFIDCFDGEIVSWALSRHPDDGLCSGSLEAALPRLQRGCTVHTDGGGVYRSNRWKEICEGNGIVRSMSRKGTSPDNARAEGFFGVLKQEFFHCRGWAGVTFAEFERLLAEYIEWYRTKRLKKSLGWRTIEEHRREWAAAS